MNKKLFGAFGQHIKSNWVMVVLGLSVVAAGALSFYTVKDINNKLQQQNIPNPNPVGQTQQQTEPEPQTEAVGQTSERVPLKPKAETNPQPSAETAADVETQAQADPTANTEKEFVLPVEGKICAAFSADELVYNKTMGDWRTHNGIDISAKAGTAVKSGGKGTVKNVYNDGMLGWTVEIENGEYTVKYSGLAENILVRQGDRVSQNQPIGTVGEIPLELADQSHIHLEITQNGNYKNPDKYFG